MRKRSPEDQAMRDSLAKVTREARAQSQKLTSELKRSLAVIDAMAAGRSALAAAYAARPAPQPEITTEITHAGSSAIN